MVVDSNKTFQEFFAEEAKAAGFSNLEKLSKASGVPLDHLENLAHGRFEKLPPAPYARGYVKKLGDILGFDGERWWKNIQKEGQVARSGEGDRLPANAYKRKKMQKWAWIGTVLALLLIYAVIRGGDIAGVPEITVHSPTKETTRVSEGKYILRGELKKGDDLFVNSEPVPVEESGLWQKEIILAEGLNTIEIKANKFLGREEVLVRRIIYSPPEAGANAKPNDPKGEILAPEPGTSP